jgi:hypothetical protein
MIRRWVPYAIVAVAAVVPYLATLGYGLVWDDPALIELVDRAYRDSGLAGVLKAEFRLDPHEPTGYYRPVVLVSLWGDHVIGRGSPTAYHATNILLHAGCALLVALIAEALLGSRWAGAAAGALFAVHPVHVESVAFTAGRTDLWAGVFVLAGTLVWLRGRGASGWRLALFAAASGAAAALGGLSKEVALAFPVVLGALEVVLPTDGRHRSWWRRLVPWLSAWVLAVTVVVAVRSASGIAFGAPALRRAQAPLVADPSLMPRLLAKTFGLLVVPWPLSVFWERDQLTWSPGMIQAAALGVGVFAAATRWCGWRLATAGAVWVLLFMAPVGGLVPLGSAPFAERFLYIPSAGFCVVVAALLAAIPPRTAGTLALAVTVLLFASGSALRATVWKDDVTLFESFTRSSPANAAAWDDLGQAYDVAGRADDAVRAYREALRLDPQRAGVWNGLGVVWGRQGRLADSERALREAVRLDPTMPHPRFNLALLCVALRERGCAEEQRRALEAIAPEAARRVGHAMRQLPE